MAPVGVVIGQIVLSVVPSPYHRHWSQVIGFLVHTIVKAKKRPAFTGPDNYHTNGAHLSKNVEKGSDARSIAIGRIQVKIGHPQEDAGRHESSHGNLASIRPANGNGTSI